MHSNPTLLTMNGYIPVPFETDTIYCLNFRWKGILSLSPLKEIEASNKDTHFTNIRQTINISAPFSKVNRVEVAVLREVMVLLAEV